MDAVFRRHRQPDPIQPADVKNLRFACCKVRLAGSMPSRSGVFFRVSAPLAARSAFEEVTFSSSLLKFRSPIKRVVSPPPRHIPGTSLLEPRASTMTRDRFTDLRRKEMTTRDILEVGKELGRICEADRVLATNMPS